jgi:hypothetical protein
MIKKTAPFLLAGFLLAGAVPLPAAQLNLKISNGFTMAGRFTDSWTSTTNYYDITRKGVSATIAAQDLNAELEYRFTPFLAISVGVGLVSKNQGSGTVEFRIPGPDSNGVAYTYSPEFSLTMIPVFATATLSIPLGTSLRLDVLGGLSYIFGKFDMQDSKLNSIPTGYASDWSYFPSELGSNSQTRGYHAGLGLEYLASEGASFYAEVLYRAISFTDFNTYALYTPEETGGISKPAGGSIFFIGEGIFPDATRGDIIYRVSKIDYSGLVVRIGINIRLALFD